MTSLSVYLPDHISHGENIRFAGAGDPLHMSMVNIRQINEESGAGAGVKIAVLDTGIDPNHPFFQDKNVRYASTCGEDGVDNHSHGTHVASTILQMAPRAEVLSIQVLGSSGSGSDQTVADGMKMAIDNGCHIINASLGGRSESPVLERAVHQLWENNVLPLIAAGNDSANSLSVPARYRAAVACGAVDFNKQHATFSNASHRLALQACGFGCRIYAAVPGGRYEEKSGTSMATPWLCGALANLFSYFMANGLKTPSRVEELAFLKPACEDLGGVGKDPEYGFGWLDPSKMMAIGRQMVEASKRTDPDPANPGLPVSGAKLIASYKGEHAGVQGRFETTFIPG